MATPAFQAVGAQVASQAAVTAVWPTHLADDIGLLVIETSGNDATVDITAPAGWAAVPGSPVVDVASTAGSKLQVWYKRAASAAETSVSVPDSGDHQIARIFTFRHCITTGDPWDVTTTGIKTTASTTATVPAVTTTVADTLITMIVGRPNDNGSTTHFGVPVNANLTSLAECAEAGSNVGNGGGFVVSTGVKATAGATGTSTLTKIASTTDTYMVIALKGELPPVQLICNTGTFAVAGVNVDLVKSSTLHGTTQAYSVVGHAVALGLVRTVAVDTTAFTVTGSSVTFANNRSLTANVGTFSVNGSTVTLVSSRSLTANVGTFSVNGSTVTLDYQQVSATTLTCDTQSYSVNGVVVTLAVSLTLDAESGAFGTIGTDAGLIKTSVIPIETGVVSVAGSSTNLGKSAVFTVLSGLFSFDTTAVFINKQYLLKGDTGLFNLAANVSINLLSIKRLPVNTQSFVILPTSPSFNKFAFVVAESKVINANAGPASQLIKHSRLQTNNVHINLRLVENRFLVPTPEFTGERIIGRPLQFTTPLLGMTTGQGKVFI